MIVRWLKFNAVGALGIAVQLSVLALLESGLGVNYLLAMAIAVEAAVLHNFFWHEQFTWASRKTSAHLRRLLGFNFSSGAVSLAGNLCLMRFLGGTLGLNYLFANMLSIAACSLINFVLADRAIFLADSPES
ncbi:MAG TPA: GtrA family protein [Terriglobales bacterium]|nr:GtrA family protein [Terriglobales bacterium]